MAGKATRLTQSFVNTVVVRERRQERFWDAGVPGLFLIVSSAGAKRYCAFYRDQEGRQREPRIGDAKIITLDQARTAALDILAGAQLHGRDAIAERRQTRRSAEMRRGRTFAKLQETYLEDGERRRSPGRHALEKMNVNKHLLPRFADRPIAELTTEDIAEALVQIASNSGNAAANTNLEVIRQMLGFALKRQWVTTNVARDLEAYPQPSRDRVGTEAELRTIWNALATAAEAGRSDGRPAALALQLSMLTLQRRSEIAGLHAREIDWSERLWTVPASRTKNKKGAHLVPLSGAAIDILRDAFGDRNDGFAFTDRSGEALEPKVMTRSFARLMKDLDITDFTVHDLRRTGATMLTSERLAVMGEIVSRILNHTPPGPAVTLIYNRNSYLPQKRAALDAWAKEIKRLSKPPRKRKSSTFKAPTAAPSR